MVYISHALYGRNLSLSIVYTIIMYNVRYYTQRMAGNFLVSQKNNQISINIIVKSLVSSIRSESKMANI